MAKKVSELEPDHAECYYNLGYIQLKLNRLNEAEVSYKKAIELKGEIPSAMNPPSGCVFRTRCPNPTHECKEGHIEMGLIEVSPNHWVDQCCINCG